MSNNSTSREALNGADIYYGRILDFFDAVGNYNQTRGIKDKLDQLTNGQWVPPDVRKAYDKYYGSRQKVLDAFDKYDGQCTRLLGYIGEALKVLHIEYTEDDLKHFEMLARGTLAEASFRTKVRGRVKRLRDNVGKEMMRRLDGEPPKPIKIETPAELITWYQTPRGKKKTK